MSLWEPRQRSRCFAHKPQVLCWALLCLTASPDHSLTWPLIPSPRAGSSLLPVLLFPLHLSLLPYLPFLSHLAPTPLQRGRPGGFALPQELPKHPQITRVTFYSETKLHKVFMQYFASSIWDKVKFHKGTNLTQGTKVRSITTLFSVRR